MTNVEDRGAVSMLVTLCATVLLLGLVSTAQAVQYQYLATTKTPVDIRKNPVRAGSLSWNCRGNQCRISGPWPTLGVSDCQALAKQVGPIVKYGYKGKWLTTEQLTSCNKGISQAAGKTYSAPRVEPQGGSRSLVPGTAVMDAGDGKSSQVKKEPAGIRAERIQPAPGVVQAAPRAQPTGTLPSPGVEQAPRGQIKMPRETVPLAVKPILTPPPALTKTQRPPLPATKVPAPLPEHSSLRGVHNPTPTARSSTREAPMPIRERTSEAMRAKSPYSTSQVRPPADQDDIKNPAITSKLREARKAERNEDQRFLQARDRLREGPVIIDTGSIFVYLR